MGAAVIVGVFVLIGSSDTKDIQPPQVTTFW
jgi:hypothetical protein